MYDTYLCRYVGSYDRAVKAVKAVKTRCQTARLPDCVLRREVMVESALASTSRTCGWRESVRNAYGILIVDIGRLTDGQTSRYEGRQFIHLDVLPLLGLPSASLCLSSLLPVCLTVLYVRLSVCLFVCLYVCLSASPVPLLLCLMSLHFCWISRLWSLWCS